MSDLICLAAIAGAHGVHGSVKVKTFTETPEALKNYPVLQTEDGKELKIKTCKPHKGDISIVSFEEIRRREAAEDLKGTRLYVARDILPELDNEEEFYHADLIGLKVRQKDKDIGTIQAIYNHGAGDILEILLEENKVICIPFTKEAVPTLSIKQGFVVLEDNWDINPDVEKKS